MKPCYRELLGKNITPELIDEEQWLNIPLLTRDKLQQIGNELVAKALPSSHGKTVLQPTSGSTGKPVETLATDITEFFWNVFSLRDTLWHHSDLGGKYEEFISEL